ncbi:MAG: class I SAM-dependent methyltransferase [Acidimicrobiia bacterium]|nr:class I SAM-dependent methyltransferase [Acidimicrobiia bacterium]
MAGAGEAALREADIRPREIFDEFLRLCAEDVRRYFATVPREPIGCPACGMAGETAFSKDGFDYAECPVCATLFVTPRPAAEAFARYYRESASSRYWATTFYPETAATRRERLWKPKALAVRDVMARHGAGGHTVVDIGGGFGLFAEEMRRVLGRPVTVLEPAPHLADICRQAGHPVVECFLEDARPGDLPAGPRTFVSFELFEHLHDPGRFLDRLRTLMAPGELFAFSTLSGLGADIRALWEDARAVSPPHHLNFLNPGSVARILGRCGFDALEVTTPGQLDVDILVNSRAFIKDRFWQAFVDRADEAARVAMQAALVATGFSSHMMVVARARA